MKYLKCYFNLNSICFFYTKVVLISAELLSKLHHLSGLLRKGWGYGSFKTKGINLIPLSFISTGLPISQDLSPPPSATDLGLPFRCTPSSPWLRRYNYLNTIIPLNILQLHLKYFFFLLLSFKFLLKLIIHTLTIFVRKVGQNKCFCLSCWP